MPTLFFSLAHHASSSAGPKYYIKVCDDRMIQMKGELKLLEKVGSFKYSCAPLLQGIVARQCRMEEKMGKAKPDPAIGPI